MKDIERFMAKVSPEPTSGCWLWVGAVKSNEYGNFLLAGKTQGAHRASYQLFRGPIGHGLYVCHACDMSACVNPQHLFLGTARDNYDDMESKGRRVIAEHGGACNPMFGRRHSELTRLKMSERRAGLYQGESHPRATVNAETVRNIRRLRVEGHQVKQIAAIVGASFYTVANIVSGKTWTTVQ